MRHRRRSHVLGVLSLAAVVVSVWAVRGRGEPTDAEAEPAAPQTTATAIEEPVDFSTQIRPLLAAKCLSCHGPDEEKRQGEFRFDIQESALGEAESGEHPIVPGDVAHSELIRRITSDDESELMPPPDSDKSLEPEEIALLRRWIEEGAPWEEHWAFIPPDRPALPEVNHANWARSDLDLFVLARMEAAAMQPSPEADRYTIIRRVSLDLIGLPPSPEEVDAFVNDDSPEAFERVVDRLLASPRFGERWARVWLDMARYADTQGYEKDNFRSIWPYRDWVIRAINDNMPFNQFTIEQIGGDLLPEATTDQQVATGFHRNTMTNTEGGTDDEEFRDLAVKDRVSTTMQIWMGLTMGCSQCHDHKYDPLTMRDFYSLYAIFNQTEDADRGDDKPRLDVEGGSTLVMRERPADQRRTTHIQHRGNFLAPGEEVHAEIPAAFGSLAGDEPVSRLDLARWLFDPQNPLTARVAVNRYWARLFGIGIVETEEDFGTQGTPPSHPELLDWLAIRFVELDWDRKAMLRELVLSATYRQSSNITPESFQADPYNRFLARGPRFRVEAEVVRDQALAASGLLSEKMFGPSVMPPQPPLVWQVVYNGQRWVTSEGEDRYRRGLYTFLRRTSPYPSSLTFDAGSGEVCMIRRVRTNTPLQALVTMNDPVFIEAAQALAARIQSEGGDSVAQRITHGFRLCLVRPPTPQEIDRLAELYKTTLEHFQSDPEAAQQLADSELSEEARLEAAVWTIVANVLLNLDETLTKR